MLDSKNAITIYECSFPNVTVALKAEKLSRAAISLRKSAENVSQGYVNSALLEARFASHLGQVFKYIIWFGF